MYSTPAVLYFVATTSVTNSCVRPVVVLTASAENTQYEYAEQGRAAENSAHNLTSLQLPERGTRIQQFGQIVTGVPSKRGHPFGLLRPFLAL